MNEESVSIVISIGSNYGNKEGNVRKACEWLSAQLSESVVSSVYFSEPVGKVKTDEVYCNAVVKGKYKGDLSELEEELKKYELQYGRTSEARAMGHVPIDLDIVIIGKEIVRPRDFSREFFLKGFREINEVV